jgi:PTS system mannose-specific IIA component
LRIADGGRQAGDWQIANRESKKQRDPTRVAVPRLFPFAICDLRFAIGNVSFSISCRDGSPTMTVGILLLTHEAMGEALIATARHILGRTVLKLDAIAIPPGSDVDLALADTAARVRSLDSGDGVLVLTDVYGATPSNVAEKLLGLGLDVHRVSGLSLPMLLRVLNYPEQSLLELAQTAASGGRSGVVIDHA